MAVQMMPAFLDQPIAITVQGTSITFEVLPDDSNTGLENVLSFSEVNLFPVPSHDVLTIEILTKESKGIHIEVKNLLGQTISRLKNQALIEGENVFTINISNLEEGGGIFFSS